MSRERKIYTRPTESHPRAWIEHHKLQYGPNWRAVAHKYLNKEKSMNLGG